MSNESLTIDRDPLLASFGQWHDENDSLASQIEESVAALSEYQQQLETWQSELDQQQSQLTADAADAKTCDDELNDGRQQEIENLNAELKDARKQIGRMSADLLAKTEELRQIDKSCADLTAEVERLRKQNTTIENATIENTTVENGSPAPPPLADVAAPAATENGLADELKQMRALLEQYTATQPNPPAPAVVSTEVSVGSVAAQFNKLRQKQAIGRAAKKPRK